MASQNQPSVIFIIVMEQPSASILSPIGPLVLKINKGHLIKLDILINPIERNNHKNFIPPEAEFAVAELRQYFNDPQWHFSIPVQPQGTTFQQTVWKSLLNIPSGETCTYGEIAEQLSTSPRAVGNACRVNPVPIVIPCHRVIAANGLGGYMGRSQQGLQQKQWLLSHEQSSHDK